MRRSELEIGDAQEMEELIRRAEVCRIGLSGNAGPYIVPMIFGYQRNCLYFHCATEGKKLDMIRENSNVCFEMDTDCQIVKPVDRPCKWSAKYRSVIGFGKAVIVEALHEKSAALNIITQHYGAEWCNFSEKELENVCVIKIEIDSMTGKKVGY